MGCINVSLDTGNSLATKTLKFFPTATLITACPAVVCGVRSAIAASPIVNRDVIVTKIK